MRLGDVLVAVGAISTEQLQSALAHQRLHGGRLGTNLVELGLVTEDDLAAYLSSQLNLPSATLATLERVPSEIIARVPAEVADRHRICPVRMDGQRLWIAMSDPTDPKALQELAEILGCEVRPMVAPESLIRHALSTHYPRQTHEVSLVATSPYDLEIETHSWEVSTTYSSSPISRSGAQEPTNSEEGPVAARMSLREFSARLAESQGEADLFDSVLTFLAQDFARVAMVTLRGNYLTGWRAQGSGVNQQALAAFSCPPEAIPVFAKAFADGKPLIGRGSPATLGELTAAIGPPGERALLVLPVRCGVDYFGCVVGNGGRPGVEMLLDEFSVVGKKVDWALQSLGLRRKILSV